MPVPSTPTITPTLVNSYTVGINYAVVQSNVTYEVYRGSTLIGTFSNVFSPPNFTDMPGIGTWTYSSRGINSSGTGSFSASKTINVTADPPSGGGGSGGSGGGGSGGADTTPPEAPTITTIAITNYNTVTVTWVADADAVQFELYRDNALQTTTANKSYVQTNMADGHYDYKVRGRDSAGNWSAYSFVSSINVQAAPNAPTSVSADMVMFGAENDRAIHWSIPSGAVLFEVFQNGVSLGTVSEAEKIVHNLADGDYYFKVKARNAGGYWSVFSAEAYTNINAAPPPVPSPVAVKTGNTQITISWSATDTAASYRLYRNGSLRNTSPALSYIDTALGDGSYAYTVSAGDSVGHWSEQSSPSSIVIDNNPPVAPSIPAVNTAKDSVTITWNTVSDAATYRVYRDGVKVYTGSSTSFSEELPNGTYVYRVTAVDTAGNISTRSEGQTVTTTADHFVRNSDEENLGRNRLIDVSLNRPGQEDDDVIRPFLNRTPFIDPDSGDIVS